MANRKVSKIKDNEDIPDVTLSERYIKNPSMEYQLNLAEAIKRAEAMDIETKAKSFTSWATTEVSTASYTTPKSAPNNIRQRLLTGAAERSIDQGGYWLHFELDSEGIPINPRFIFADDKLTEWYYVEDKQPRVFERLPVVGLYIFLY